jgi:PhoD-like phosphatase
MPDLVLGPLLRYVDETSATVWVETEAPCVVSVLDAHAPTFTVHGHHYALVDVTGLGPGSCTPYTVRLDGEPRWPPPDSPFPPSRIRTIDPTRRLRLSFGSCRTSVPHDEEHNRSHGIDVLRALGNWLTTVPEDQWPDLLLMLGDQVYADELSEPMREFIEHRRGLDEPPGAELADYEEYAHLYRLAWTEPTNRWLLSTLPSMMIFDDHDIRDDWNTSKAWRDNVATLPWWPARIVGGLGSYWIYQHSGNLSITERATDPLFTRLRTADGDAGDILDEFGATADARPESIRWSYARDIGRVRLIVLDSRCGRVLAPGARTILDQGEWDWFDGLATGDVDQLLIGTSMPYVLPRGLHELEAWNEATTDGRWGRRFGRLGERLRQGLDLEHWAAFRRSFESMAAVVDEVSAGRRGAPPANVIFLSGDVHYSYLMRAYPGGGRFAGPADGGRLAGPASGGRLARPADGGLQRGSVYQIVCSPIRNPLPRLVRYANVAGSFAIAGFVGRGLARSAGIPKPSMRWELAHGPLFDNAIATLDIDQRKAVLRWETAKLPNGSQMPEMVELTKIELD